jgi:hypothetical protein
MKRKSLGVTPKAPAMKTRLAAEARARAGAPPAPC